MGSKLDIRINKDDFKRKLDIKDGKTPTPEELLTIIKPLIPEVKDGKDGAQGAKGDKGDKGDPGKDGKDGLNGRDGKDGVNGIDGKDGKDAIQTEADITNIAIKINPIIEYSKIKNAPQWPAGGLSRITKDEVQQMIDAIPPAANAFTDLTDTFPSYTGLAGKGLRVNGTETGIDTYTPTDTDEKVKYDSGDPTAGYVADKFVAGTGISVAEGVGANENKLVITNTGIITEADTLDTVTDRGATTTNAITTGGLTTPYVESTTSYTPTGLEPIGTRYWNAVKGTTSLRRSADSTLDDGQELGYYVKANGAISNGQLVQFAGYQGDHYTAKVCVPAEVIAFSRLIMGIATEDIADGEFGNVTAFGEVTMNTTGWSVDDKLYFDNTTGQLTNVVPNAPEKMVLIGVVVKEETSPAAANGRVLTRITWGMSLDELDDVDGSAPTTTGDLLTYNSSGVWERGAYNITDYTPTSSLNISNWDTAYSWGNHADAGYALTSSLSAYAKLDGSNHPFTTVKTPILQPNADSTSALKITKADGTTALVTFDTTNSVIGFGTTPTSVIFARYSKSHTQLTSGSTVAQYEGTHTLNADNTISWTGNINSVGLNTAGFNSTVAVSSGGSLTGGYSLVQLSSTPATGTTTAINGFRTSVRNTGAATLTNAISYLALPVLNSGGGVLTNAYGFYSSALTAGTNNYDFYGLTAAAANRWSLYLAGGADNYLLGNTGIGSNNPLGGINSDPTFFRPLSTGKLLSVYSSTVASLNLRSGINTSGGIVGGVYFSRELGQGDAHQNIGAIQARQIGTGTLAGGQLWFFTKNNGSGNLANDARGVLNERGYWALGHTAPLDTVHTKGITRIETSSGGIARVGTDSAMGAPVNPTANIRMDIGSFSISGWYPILSQNAYWTGTAWTTTSTGYSLLQYTDPSTGDYTLINSNASYVAGTNLSTGGRLTYNYVFYQNGRFKAPYVQVGNSGTAGHRLDVFDGGLGMLIGGDSYATTRTNSTNKFARIGVPHYTNAEEPMAILTATAISGSNDLYFGGGTSAYNAATSIYFYTASNSTTVTGTEAMRINSAQNVGIGTSPSARLHAVATTEQLRLGYDASNYMSATVNSTGSLTLALTGTTPKFTFSQAVKVSTLTSGRVVFATTGGELVDDAGLAFATGTLTATNIVGSTSVKAGTAGGFISSDGSTGATGTFTTADSKTVTVKDGIITSIV